MRKFVLDTSFLFLYFLKIKDAINIMNEVNQQKAIAYTTYLNISEFFYISIKHEKREEVENKINIIMNSPIKIVPLNKRLALRAGEIKAKHDFLSLVDCYVIALAEIKKAQVVTSDSSIANVYKDTILIKKI